MFAGVNSKVANLETTEEDRYPRHSSVPITSEMNQGTHFLSSLVPVDSEASKVRQESESDCFHLEA